MFARYVHFNKHNLILSNMTCSILDIHYFGYSNTASWSLAWGKDIAPLPSPSRGHCLMNTVKSTGSGQLPHITPQLKAWNTQPILSSCAICWIKNSCLPEPVQSVLQMHQRKTFVSTSLARNRIWGPFRKVQVLITDHIFELSYFSFWYRSPGDIWEGMQVLTEFSTQCVIHL